VPCESRLHDRLLASAQQDRASVNPPDTTDPTIVVAGGQVVAVGAEGDEPAVGSILSMDGLTTVELLFWDGCSSDPHALSELRATMTELGLDPEAVAVREVDTDDAAEENTSSARARSALTATTSRNRATSR
jgi:hypothetical protein